MTFLVTFIILTIVNVVFSTIKSITTIKSGKFVASLISGLYYGYYNIVLIYTVQDFPMWQKCLITFVCNLIGVWIVKFAEEKMRKDKLWKVELTTKNSKAVVLHTELDTLNIPHNYIENVGKYAIFNIYCKSQKESALVREVANRHSAKYFVTESKIL